MKMRLERWGRGAGVALVLGLLLGALSACDDLLEVDLPAQLTNEALEDPNGAETQVNSAIGLFECAYSAYAWQILGNEDVFEVVAGVASGSHRYFPSADVFAGDCDSDSEDNDWYEQVSASRALAQQVYGKLQNEWTVDQVPNRQELSAISALYVTASLDHFGQMFCEMAIDAGELMTPDQTLGMAETWAQNSLDRIGDAGGDFAMPHGIASSAQEMAYGLRARIRWARGDMANALSDAQNVSQGFTAVITRESGAQRRNKVYDAGTAVGFSGIQGVNDWWTVADRSIPSSVSDPVWGAAWPDPIPFTGYLFLGIMPATGRAVMDNGMPVRWAEEERDLGEDPTPLGNGAVEDTRIQHFIKRIQGPEPREVPDKYQSLGDDITFVNWKEAWLIRADIQNRMNDDQATAIGLLNDIRDDAGLPEIQGAYMAQLTDGTNDQEEVRFAITEEWRRALWLEGRYYPYKIQNTDLLWFPRAQGVTEFQGYTLEGAVRLVMPDDEYNLNTNTSLADRGTVCDPAVRPVQIE